MKEVVIVAAGRTPIGSFSGCLASQSAVKLGALALKETLTRGQVNPEDVDEFFFGNVLSADLGQAPARQVALEAGLPHTVICTTINKVCSSSLKATSLAAQSIMIGTASVIAVVGAENMSQTPYYVQNVRGGLKMGHAEMTDGVIKDGLWDPVNNFHMGMAAELCSDMHKISREEQDAYACRSYQRAADAYKRGSFANELIPVEIPVKGGTKVVSEDEEYTRVIFEKVPKLKPTFKIDGTVTAANASPLSDGAAAVILMSAEKAAELDLKPIARILGFADAEKRPEEFTTAPSLAIPKALSQANVKMSDIEYFEINEAFAAVALANCRILGLDEERVNIHGGAVALGHPLGCSGVRILVTLLNVLQHQDASNGVAAICNGGGGSTALVVERLNSFNSKVQM
mmetsp:Transcript_9367/g.28229  ORF Transcript_9367/g.28229 Transcript_9367/m.28229 type:complete len:401 (+) Transcript_9367:75-1277(+)|eukprot:CAMPEP_0198727972 /NCGR_PEP_ID=MMETSP1475-20131203/6650_1 /TAXON_ID= ORGANISM="Unidentified sp., Strain CCMP1999" /NCGR_SAMPLE_ID=MMETSP1475 /ASSEMBLY_ACC=CAM_ASM_001111 /LENGTH=400 /DNA_ID=CAMNT_0044490203 /DNA_START=51 /DNA_END=1253 /DNA_ORIENTATION=-